MRVPLFLARAELRRRLWSALALAALVGLAGAAVLIAWGGARRTESAYPRLLERTGAADVSVDAAADLNAFDPAIVRGAPGVTKSSAVYGFGALDLTSDGLPNFESAGYFFTAAVDADFYQLSGPLLVAGRLPRATAANEVVVNRETRDSGHPLGSTMTVCVYNFDEIGGFFDAFGEAPPSDERLRAVTPSLCSLTDFRVVGVGRFASELVITESAEEQRYIFAGPGFAAAPPKPRSYAFALATLDRPASLGAFGDYVRQRADPAAAVRTERTALRTLVVQRTAQPYVRALLFFAIAAALTSAGVLGPALLRWSRFPEGDRAALLGAGCRSRELRTASALRAAAIGVGAAALAAAIAVAASPLFPIGPLRQAEPESGVRVDVLVFVAGVFGIVALCALVGAARPRRPGAGAATRPSTAAESLAQAGAGPALVVGVRSALSRERAAGAGPIATGAGMVVAIAAISAALVFGAGLTRLLDSPTRFGWTWDATFEGFEGGVNDDVIAQMRTDPIVEAATLGHRSGITLNGDSVPGFAFSDLRGAVRPSILSGRAPAGRGEVALGGQTLDRLGLEIGDHVRLGGPGQRTVRGLVVGRTLLPIPNLSTDVSVGEGAWVELATFERLGGGDTGFVLVDVTRGGADALRARLTKLGLIPEESDQVMGPQHTADLRGYARVRTIPLMLAGLLGILGAGVLAHTLVSSARARRAELAVLKCLGFRRSQVASTVRWHAVAIVLFCVAAGLPAGVVVGRRLWATFAHGLGVVDDAVTPLAAVALVGVMAMVLAALMSWVPGRAAARVQPAVALRSSE